MEPEREKRKIEGTASDKKRTNEKKNIKLRLEQKEEMTRENR
jgi:hypothetical protein